MSGFLGMVPAQADELATTLDGGAEAIDSLVADVARALGGTTWVGEDRQAFEACWSGDLTRALNDLGSLLRDTATIARSNAEQQRQASA